MARYVDGEYEWDNEKEDWDESDDDASFDDEESEPTMPCPYCRAEIHEDSLRCPFCENYLSRNDSQSERKPLWLVIGVLACLLVVLWWVFFI